MGRGIFFGFIWGGLVSVLGLSVASIVGESPQMPMAESLPAVEAAETDEAEPEAETATMESELASEETTEPDDVASASPETSVPAPMGIDQPEVPLADTSPAALPETGAIAPAPDAPVVADENTTDVTAEEPVLPAPQAMAPQQSEEDASPVVRTEVPAPEATPAETEAAEAEATENETQISEEAPEVVAEAPEAPVAPVVEGEASTPEPAEDAPAVASESAETTEDDAATEAESAAEGTPEPTEDTTDPEAEQTSGPRLALQGEQGTTLGEPVGTFGDRAENVQTGRLPAITEEPSEPAEDAAAEAAVLDPDAPPLERFAGAWENPENRPLMSILLIDDGSSPIGSDALRSFPYPITFAVSATAPDAAEMMQKYRDEGFEVLALAALPDGASPSDIEVALDASLGAVPEAAGVLVAGDVPGGRQGTEQIIERLGRSGHGLVTASTGLNATAQLSESTGFPAANIFDDIDSEGQTPTVIRRFLDNAAFRAGQGEEVIMMGRIRPDTISALLLWGLGDRAARVALVPVSAVLTAE